jgi:uncharacterized protein involved in exopolysaccharide biosynthesis
MIQVLIQGGWRTRLILLGCIIFFFLCVGGSVFFLFLPRMAGSAAEIVGNSQVVSIDGLARYQQTDPRRGVEFQNAVQLLTSRAAAEYASQTVGTYTPEEIIDRTALKVTPESGLVTLSVTANSGQKASEILAAILEKAEALDREQRTQEAERLITAVEKKLAGVAEHLKDCTQRIAKFLNENKVTVNNDVERQRSAAALLAQYHQNELAIRMESSRLASILHESNTKEDMIETEPADADRSRETPLDEARRHLDQTQTQVAQLESRYGENHPSMKAARAQLAEAQTIFKTRIREAGQRIKTNLNANQDVLGEVARESGKMEDRLRSSNISLDPEYIALVAEQENNRLLQQQLEERLVELQVYQGSLVSSFKIISPPYSIRTRNLKALLAILALSFVLGIVSVLTLLYVLSRKKSEAINLGTLAINTSSPEWAD